jgi:hypothetical protein
MLHISWYMLSACVNIQLALACARDKEQYSTHLGRKDDTTFFLVHACVNRKQALPCGVRYQLINMIEELSYLYLRICLVLYLIW